MTTPAVQLPQFGHSVFYAYLIEVNKLNIGSIQKMSVKSDRTTERIGEINYNNGLAWKDILWGYESVTIDLSHIEFYQQSFLQLFSANAVASLTEMNFAFDIIEYQFGNNAVLPVNGQAATGPAAPVTGATIQFRSITYAGCVPKSFSRTIDRGTIQIVEEMSVECRSVTVANVAAGTASAG
jgi:hypothetical protein